MPDNPYIFPILLTGFYRFSARKNGKITELHTLQTNMMNIIRIRLKNKNPRRSLSSARKWRRRWDSNPRDVAANSISSRARYDRFDTPPCINLSMILYEELISSQPRYDHFDTSPCPVIISGI